MRNTKFAFHLDPACRDQRGKGGTKFTAGDQLVIGAAAKSLGGIVAPQQPDWLGLRRFFRELRQIDQRADRRVPGAQHGDGLAGIAGAVLPSTSGMP